MMVIELKKVGLTPRLNGVIQEVIKGAPLPTQREYKEEKRGLFRTKFVDAKANSTNWTTKSISWEEGNITITLHRSFVRNNDRGLTVGEVEIWSVSVPVGDISPLSIPQAAGLGADVSRKFSRRYWGSAEIDVTPTVWWGVADDVIEAKRRFPHLFCEE